MKKIYACDDDMVVLMMVKRILGSGYQVETSQSINGLLEKLDADRPDLILLDYLMPECDGLEAIAMLREKGYFPGIPIVVVTGDRDISLEVKCRDEGVEDFIQKPFVPDILLARVKQVLARK